MKNTILLIIAFVFLFCTPNKEEQRAQEQSELLDLKVKIVVLQKEAIQKDSLIFYQVSQLSKVDKNFLVPRFAVDQALNENAEQMAKQMIILKAIKLTEKNKDEVLLNWQTYGQFLGEREILNQIKNF